MKTRPFKTFKRCAPFKPFNLGGWTSETDGAQRLNETK